MSIQFTVLGFEPTAFNTRVSSHNHQTMVPDFALCDLQIARRKRTLKRPSGCGLKQMGPKVIRRATKKA